MAVLDPRTAKLHDLRHLEGGQEAEDILERRYKGAKYSDAELDDAIKRITKRVEEVRLGKIGALPIRRDYGWMPEWGKELESEGEDKGFLVEPPENKAPEVLNNPSRGGDEILEEALAIGQFMRGR